MTHQRCLRCCHTWQAEAQTTCPVCVALHGTRKPPRLGQVRRVCMKCNYTWHGEACACPACQHPYAKVTS
jgi:rubrerythrin